MPARRIRVVKISIGHVIDQKLVLCPPAKENIADPNYVSDPRSALRRGNWALDEFWQSSPTLQHIYAAAKNNVVYLHNLATEIALLSQMHWDEPINRDRIHWFVYWTTHATQKYGDRAAMSICVSDEPPMMTGLPLDGSVMAWQ